MKLETYFVSLSTTSATMTTMRNYSQEDLAVEDVKNGLSFQQAVIKYGVPKTTLVDYCKRGTTTMQKIGKLSVLTKEEEDFLVWWLQSCLDRGFPRLKENKKIHPI